MNRQKSNRGTHNYVLLNAFILIVTLMKIGASAQDEKKVPAPSLDGVKVTNVRNTRTNEAAAGINDRIEITVENLKPLLQVSNCRDQNNAEIQNCTPKKVALFLDGREIKGLFPDGGAPELDPKSAGGTLQFDLARNKDTSSEKDNDKAWADLLGAPKIGGGRFWERSTSLSIGLQNDYPKSISHQFPLIRIHFWWFIICTAILLIVLAALWRLAKYTELLRDTGPMPYADPVKKEEQTPAERHLFGFFSYQAYEIHKPYSLARFQMAFWFSFVIIAFLYIFMVNGAYDTITTSVLALIGIGAGTALGAAIIDSGKDNQTAAEFSALKDEKAALEPSITALNAQITATPPPDQATLTQISQEVATKQARLDLVKARIAEIEKIQAPQKSQGFLMDVLTDESNGISFHRFQMLAWTLILGILFVYQVWYRLSMPDFDATLLALMGISSGTYLGFKIPEKQ